MTLAQRISELCDTILAGRFIGDRLSIVQELRRYVEEDWPAGRGDASYDNWPPLATARKEVRKAEDVAQDYGARACCTPVVLSVGQKVLSRDANGDWRPARLTSVNPLGAYPFEVEYTDGRSATSIGGNEVQRAWKKPADIRPIPREELPRGGETLVGSAGPDAPSPGLSPSEDPGY